MFEMNINFDQSLPPSLCGLSRVLCNHFQVDQALVIPVILGLASSVAHDKFMVEISDYVTGSSFVEPLSLFCLGIANSSERKSPVMKWLKAPIQEAIDQENSILNDKMLKQKCERELVQEEIKKNKKKIARVSNEDSQKRDFLIDKLCELEKKLLEPVILPQRLFLQDTTAIAAAEFMEKQKGSGMFIADAEGGSFDSILSDHRLLELLLSGFSNESISYERSSKASVEIKSPHSGLCILTQDVKLHKLAKKVSTWDEGFIPRCLIFLAPEMAGRRSTAIGPAIPEDFKLWWASKCKFLLTYPQKQEIDDNRHYHILKMSNDAALVWRNFSGQLENMMQPGAATYPLRTWLGKMSAVAVRVASLYHLLEADEPVETTITALHMQQACNLIITLIPYMHEVHKLYFPDNNAVQDAIHKIVNWLKQEQGTISFFKFRDMYRELNIKVKEARCACDCLVSFGVLQLGALLPEKVGRNATPVYSVLYHNLNTFYPLALY